MKSFVIKMLIAIFGLSLVSAPLAASAAQWGVGVGVRGGGVAVRGGYSNGWHGGYAHAGYGWRPGPGCCTSPLATGPSPLPLRGWR